MTLGLEVNEVEIKALTSLASVTENTAWRGTEGALHGQLGLYTLRARLCYGSDTCPLRLQQNLRRVFCFSAMNS
jgi:hypothetical protein